MTGLRSRLVLAAVLLSAIGGCQDNEAAKPSVEDVRPAKIATVSYSVSDSTGSLVGIVSPRVESSLGFRVGGKIAERLADIGDVVDAGAVLARLDPVQAQNTLNQAQASVAAASAQKENAEQQERRQTELLGRGFATQAAFDAATAGANVARANLASAEAALRNADETLSYMDLKADAHGVVTARGAEVGQVVAAGQMVMQLARIDLRDAVFQAPESALKADAATAQVRVTLLNDPAATTLGKVREIAPAADPVTRTFRVKVGLDNPPDSFRFGSAVRGTIEQKGQRLAALPITALYETEGSPAVWVADAAGVVQPVHVTIARYEGDRVLVSAGVAEGARVVVAGIQRLRPGMKIRPLEATS